MKPSDYQSAAEEEVSFSKSIIKTSQITNKSVSLMEALLVDCPIPSNEDFKKILGIQASICFRLSLTLMNEANGKKKIDRDLLRLAMKAMEMSANFCDKGARINLDEGDHQGGLKEDK